MTTTLKQANADLEAFNLTLSEDNEDTPETLLEQERLIAAVIAAEAADLPSLSAKQLVDHFQKRAPGQHLPKGLAKSAIIDRITKLPPLEPTPAPAAAEPEPTFSVAAYAKEHGLDGRELRKLLRGSGKRAPYALSDVEEIAKAVKS